MHGKNPVLIAQTHVNRAKLSSYYSRIALHIMAKYARNNKIQLKTKLERDEDIPAEVATLDSARKKIESYMNRHDGLGAFSSKSEDWLQNDEKWLRELRHEYFHFSARFEIGNEPRFIRGRRQRMYYDG